MSDTPGPWKPVRSFTCGHLRAGHNFRENPREEWTDEDIALIAAAPDLLEAAKAALVQINYAPDTTIDVVGLLEAAIAKAEGGAK